MSPRQQIFLEAATEGVLQKKVFLKMSQNSQENFIKKETLAQVLSCEFCEIFKNIFLTEHLWTTASLFSTSPKTSFLQKQVLENTINKNHTSKYSSIKSNYMSDNDGN